MSLIFTFLGVAFIIGLVNTAASMCHHISKNYRIFTAYGLNLLIISITGVFCMATILLINWVHFNL